MFNGMPPADALVVALMIILVPSCLYILISELWTSGNLDWLRFNKESTWKKIKKG